MENPIKGVTEGEGVRRKRKSKRKVESYKKPCIRRGELKKGHRFQVIHSSQQKGRKVSYIKYTIATHLLKRKGGKEKRGG